MPLSVMDEKKFYGWVNLGVVALISLVTEGLLLLSFAVFLPYICNEFNWSRGSVSGAMAVTTALGGLISPLAGIFIAKFGARAAIILGNSIAVIACLLLSFHNQIWQFYLGSGILMGLAIGLGGPIATTTTINNWFIKKRSIGIAIVLSCGSLGGLILVPLIQFIISSLGWRHAYLIMAATTLVLSIIIPGILVRNKPEDLGQVPDGKIDSDPENAGPSPIPKRRDVYRTPVDFEFKEAIRTPCLWFLTLVLCLQMLGTAGLLAHGVAFLIDIGIAAGAASFAFGLFSGIGTVGRLGVGFLGLRYDVKKLALGSLVIMIIGMIILIYTKTFAMAILFSCVLGIGSGGIMVSVMNMIPNYFGNKNYPKIMGFMTPFFIIIGGLSSPIAGIISDMTGSYILYFQSGLILLVISSVLLYFARPPLHPSLIEGKVLNSQIGSQPENNQSELA